MVFLVARTLKEGGGGRGVTGNEQNDLERRARAQNRVSTKSHV